MSLESLVRQSTPTIDQVVSDYAAGYVAHIETSANEPGFAQDLNVSGEVQFVKSMLISAGANEKAIAELAEKLKATFTDLKAKNANKVVEVARRLDRDTLLHAQRKNQGAFNVMGGDGAELDLLKSNRSIESKVDMKKLAKAEKKLAAKQAKKEARYVEYEASKLLTQTTDEDYDKFFLTVNPLLMGGDEGRSKDVKIENFDLHVGAGKRILSGASLTLAYGRRYGVVGQNGIGKSTLLKAIAHRELPIPKHISILYVEQEVVGDDKSALQTVLDADVWRKHLLQEQDKLQAKITSLNEQRDQLGDISDDDPAAQLLDEERVEAESSLQEVFDKLADIESDKAESRAASILAGLGFSVESQHNPTKSFSGGWRMRLALARALFFKPDLLMLDEPSNMLDVPSITFLADYLQTYPSTVLVVSHDRAFLNEVATDIIYQHNERLDYYRGANFDSFYATREERHKNAVREYENQMAYRKHLQTFIDKFRYNAGKAAEAQSRIKKLEKLPILEPPEEDKAVTFRFPDPEPLSPPIIQLQGVSFYYNEDRVLLNNVDLDVQMNSRIALVGGNGCGKTTLLKLLIEQLRPKSGTVSHNTRLRVGYFAQHHVDGMDINMTPVGWMAKVQPGKSDEEYRRMLGAFGITGTLGLQKIALLSGGQKSRVAFACLGLSNPHILILDEPSNHLDTAGLDALTDALANFKGGILMVSHDVAVIDRVCSEIWVSENGAVEKFRGSIYDYKKRILQSAGRAGVVAKH